MRFGTPVASLAAMRTTAVVTGFAVVLLLASSARAECSDGTEGPCDSSAFAAAFAGIVLAGITEGSFAVGGLITMIGGGHDLAHGGHKRSWRIANTVFGTLNLAAGLVWAGFAAARISPSFTIPFAVPHLAVGIGDIVVAAVSWDHSRSAPPVALVPLVGGDAQHGTVAGLQLIGRF
jgi:hypothetical protein